jgi:hypothetical protein
VTTFDKKSVFAFFISPTKKKNCQEVEKEWTKKKTDRVVKCEHWAKNKYWFWTFFAKKERLIEEKSRIVTSLVQEEC